MDFKGMTMSQLIEAHNVLATEKGRPNETEFKNLAAARAAITDLENLNMEAVQQDPAVGDQAPAADGTAAPAVASGDPSKYSTVGKRGPTQGVGEFAKELLSKGMATADVLAAVKTQFPTAKTSASCIAYYKAALKNPNLGKRKGAGGVSSDPAAMRAKAAELISAAQAAEAANAAQAVENAKKAVEAAEAAKKIAEAALAAQAALAEQAAATAEVKPADATVQS